MNLGCTLAWVNARARAPIRRCCRWRSSPIRKSRFGSPDDVHRQSDHMGTIWGDTTCLGLPVRTANQARGGARGSIDRQSYGIYMECLGMGITLIYLGAPFLALRKPLVSPVRLFGELPKRESEASRFRSEWLDRAGCWTKTAV